MSRPPVSVDLRLVEDNSGEVIKMNRQLTRRLVAAVTAGIEARAKLHLQHLVYDPPENTYKRTGHLMNSQGSEVLDLQGEVFNSADYAEHVHEGTTRMSPRPWLEMALRDELPEIEKRAKRIADGGNS